MRPKYGLGCTTNVRMVIQLTKDLEWTIAHSLQSNRVARSFEFTRHSSIVGIPVENNTGTKEWTKMARSIMISRIIKRWWNSHHILDKRDGNTSEVRKINCWVAVISRFTQNTNKLCWTEGKKVVDENRNHRGQGWYFSSWIQLISWKSSECWWWSRHICREISCRCSQSATVSSQRNDEARGYWNHSYDTNSNSSLLFKVKGYDEEKST